MMVVRSKKKCIHTTHATTKLHITLHVVTTLYSSYYYIRDNNMYREIKYNNFPMYTLIQKYYIIFIDLCTTNMLYRNRVIPYAEVAIRRIKMCRK